MPIVEAECVVPMEASEFWQVRGTPEFMEFSRVEQNLIALEVLEEYEEDGHKCQNIRTVPNVSIPRIVKPILGGKPLEFVDLYKTPLSTPPYTQSFVTTPPVLPNKIKVSGELTVTPINDQECRQKLVANVDVSVWGAGKVISNIIMDNMKTSMANIPKLVQKWKLDQLDAEMERQAKAPPPQSPRQSAVSQDSTSLLMASSSPAIGGRETPGRHRTESDSQSQATDTEWFHDASEMHHTGEDMTDGYITPGEDELDYESANERDRALSVRSNKSVARVHGHSAATHAKILGYQSADLSDTSPGDDRSPDGHSRTRKPRSRTTESETIQYQTFAIGSAVGGSDEDRWKRRGRNGTQSGYHEFDASPGQSKFKRKWRHFTHTLGNRFRRMLICVCPADDGLGHTTYGRKGQPMLSANFETEETI
eukprot:TRINITY_DN18708_c0_g1_i1.p1 TRINITY_DN18708_c0_g1~~TRINITY_DN18708_c0_g1_i1.p1  ORF type:complete len:423 (-),score=39.68 TRINITY_DN18708_c0_g1_i1:32-1300(-)